MKDATGEAGDRRGVAARDELARLVTRMGAGKNQGDAARARLESFRYDASMACEIIEAQRRASPAAIVLAGEIVGDLELQTHIDAKLCLCATLTGSLRVAGPADVDGDLVLEGASIAGDVELSGGARVGGQLILSRGTKVTGDVVLKGRAQLDGLVVGAGAVIGGSIQMNRSSKIDGDLRVRREGRVEGHVRIAGGSTVTGDVVVEADAAVGGDMWIRGHATVDGALSNAGSVGGGLQVGGRVGTISVTGQVEGASRLAPRPEPDASPVGLVTLRRAQLGRQMHVGDRVSIAECDFRQCGDLDQLELVGADLFTCADRSQAVALANPPAGIEHRVTDGEMASIYRQLRVCLEGKGNRPASAFFYRGEMDSRRRAARQRGGRVGWVEWGWLNLYRGVAGYGLRVTPPLVWFGVLLGVSTVFLHHHELVVLRGEAVVRADWGDTFTFALQSMLSLFRSPDAIGFGTTLVQVGLRILGPILLGLAAFAVRDKVAR